MSLIEENQKNNKNTFFVFIILIFAAAIIALGFIVFQKSRNFKPDETIIKESQPLTNEQSEQKEIIAGEKESKLIFTNIEGENFEVILESNPRNEEKTDIYIKNTATDEITFLVSLDLVQKNIKNGVQYVNGKLYIIRRINYDGYPDEDWNDDLWVYTSTNDYQNIYSSKGLTSLVNSYNNYIAVSSNNGDVAILNQRYQTIHSFSKDELDLEVAASDYRATSIIKIYQWNNNDLWLTNNVTVNLTGLTKIDALTGKITKYLFKHSTLDNKETAINININKIAYSDFPVFFGAGDPEDFAQTDEEVTLYLYDFITHERSIIDTSIVKAFRPKWIDDNTLEYNDPDSESKRIQVNY